MKKFFSNIVNRRILAGGLILAVCIAVFVCFLKNSGRDRYSLRIVVPAGSQDCFVYANEQISPLGKYITITSGEGLGDTEVELDPVQNPAAADEGSCK